MKFYKSSLNSNNNKATYKEFFGCPGTGLCSVQWFVFLVLDLLILWGHNFLISNLFSTIVNVSNVLRGEVQVLFGHQNNRALPLDPACLERLTVRSQAGLPYRVFLLIRSDHSNEKLSSPLWHFLGALYLLIIHTPIKASMPALPLQLHPKIPN